MIAILCWRRQWIQRQPRSAIGAGKRTIEIDKNAYFTTHLIPLRHLLCGKSRHWSPCLRIIFVCFAWLTSPLYYSKSSAIGKCRIFTSSHGVFTATLTTNRGIQVQWVFGYYYYNTIKYLTICAWSIHFNFIAFIMRILWVIGLQQYWPGRRTHGIAIWYKSIADTHTHT